LSVQISKTAYFELNFYISLQAQWFTRAFCSGVMKRESGENPEQTRCCKLIFWLTIDNDQLTIEENVLNNTFATVLPTATTDNRR
jgi:hypothetical protein